MNKIRVIKPSDVRVQAEEIEKVELKEKLDLLKHVPH